MSRHPVITIFGLAVLVLAHLSATAQERCEACGGKDRLENPKANVAPPAAKTIYNNLGTGSNLFNKSAGLDGRRSQFRSHSAEHRFAFQAERRRDFGRNRSGRGLHEWG